MINTIDNIADCMTFKIFDIAFQVRANRKTLSSLNALKTVKPSMFGIEKSTILRAIIAKSNQLTGS